MAHDRIDLHHHMMPPSWLEHAVRVDPHLAGVPPWSPEASLRAMDALGTRLAVLSLTTPRLDLGLGAGTAAFARRVNEEAAEVVAARPDRFAALAALPLDDVDDAVTEACHAMDHLGAVGVALLSNHDGSYLGDPRLAPLWDALDARDAIVFVHPTQPCGLAHLPGAPGWVDWPFDTTRAAVSLVVHGVLRDHARIRFVLAHAGGFLPYQIGRFEALASITPGLDLAQVRRDLRGFWHDTALSTAPSTLAALLELAGPERIVFGTDWPAAPDAVAARFVEELDAFTAVHDGLAEAVDHRNAERLLGPRLEEHR